MGGEPLRKPAPFPTDLAGPVEGLEHIGHFPHVVIEAQRVFEPQLVGLVFRVAAVLEEQHSEPLAGDSGELRDVGGENAAHAEAQRGELRLADLLHRVPGGDVPDLVPQHGGQLGLAVHVGEEAAGHVDESAGQREGVDRGVVHHVEFPGEIGPLRLRGHALADAGDVGLELGIVHEADALPHFLGRLLAHLNLLALGDQGDLVLPGDRVAGAARDRAGDQRGPEQPSAEAQRKACGEGENGTTSHWHPSSSRSSQESGCLKLSALRGGGL